MDLLKDPRVVIGGGIGLALALGVVAAILLGAGRDGPKTAPPASEGGLVIEIGRDEVKLDPNRKLPCYVAGVSVGMTTLAECASRNGITSGQLDVGIDRSGAMAFGELGTAIAPLPPNEGVLSPAPAPAPLPPAPDTASAPAATPLPAAEPSRGPVAACWRFENRAWVRVSETSLQSCVLTLFDGRCERPGAAAYGRWGEQTLRLVPGRVEQSPDNRNFRTLTEQSANCTFGAF